MDYYLIGIDHRSAPPAVRAQFHLTAKQIAAIYDSHRVPPETVILATCNRTEFYFYTDWEPAKLWESLEEIYPEHTIAWTGFYQKRSASVILHLLRLAVGLQSMITGETEILGQVGAACEWALRAGNTSEFGCWGRLFRKIPEYARYIRKKSRIGAYSSSLASLAVKEVKQYFGRNRVQSGAKISPKALILGHGVIAQKISRVFFLQGIEVIIVSRDSKFQGECLRAHAGEVQRYDWEHLGQALAETDIVVAATTAPHFLLKEEHFEHLKGKVLIDLAFPRNIDPAVTAAVNCILWDLSYFGEKSGTNQVLKRQATEKAENLCLLAVERIQAINPVESPKSKRAWPEKDYHKGTSCASARRLKGSPRDVPVKA
jgi:glutamyl-tRNA reductase